MPTLNLPVFLGAEGVTGSCHVVSCQALAPLSKDGLLLVTQYALHNYGICLFY